MSVPHIIIVTGTDTGVGKTITTAAAASVLVAAGRRVSTYKPCQTGTDDGDDDAREVLRLSGVESAVTGVRLRAPLAPAVAARLEGADLPDLAMHADRVRALAEISDHVIVEGAGGLLVALDGAGGTIADLACLLGAGCIVVTRAALGTLNHTALTLEAMSRRDLSVLGLVIGSWPIRAGAAALHNRSEFEAGADTLLGVIPEGAAELPPEVFRARSGAWLDGFDR